MEAHPDMLRGHAKVVRPSGPALCPLLAGHALADVLVTATRRDGPREAVAAAAELLLAHAPGLAQPATPRQRLAAAVLRLVACGDAADLHALDWRQASRYPFPGHPEGAAPHAVPTPQDQLGAVWGSAWWWWLEGDPAAVWWSVPSDVVRAMERPAGAPPLTAGADGCERIADWDSLRLCRELRLAAEGGGAVSGERVAALTVSAAHHALSASRFDQYVQIVAVHAAAWYQRAAARFRSV